MGFFRDLGNLVSRPVRGIGRMLRGNVRQGLRDIGSTAKTLAPAIAFIPGVGTAAAIGIGAAGGALASKRGAKVGDVLRSTAEGGAAGASGEAMQGLAQKALPGIGKALGVGQNAAEAATTATRAAGDLASVEGVASAASAAPAAAVAAPAVAAPAAPAAATMAAPSPTGIGRYINPTTLKLAELGLGAYGSAQEGAAMDRMAALEEQGLKRRWDLDDRRRGIAQQILRDRQAARA